MRKRIAKWYLCFFLVMITVIALRSAYFSLSPQGKQHEETIVNAYMEIPYSPETVIVKPFTIWRKEEHRSLSYTCKSLLPLQKLRAFYDDFFQKQGAKRTISHDREIIRSPRRQEIIAVNCTYRTEDCVYYFKFYQSDPTWSVVTISIRAATDTRGN
ncbi:hypothetical protein BCS37_10220 [Selenomonas sp. oral taxon 920]|uniref:hypothetical protein n=1 Tax=Selenomonas sp. oral taxon 920 TaxID=1884263 RepID=UPI000840C7EC|nr:hypothetical protein [Selenomonas sp. oral taxon 920]AOH48795.1 hypothetical protein BCS37_10220 [Selenomonas sp. oral taxon 920]